MYLILTKTSLNNARSFHPYYTDDKIEVHNALNDKDQERRVYRLDGLTRIWKMVVEFEEIECEGVVK